VTSGGGETAKDVSGWTTDTLKAHIERLIYESDRRYNERFAAQEKAVVAALAAAAEAVAKAEYNAERWRNNANEWRAAMTDRERNFMSRDQADAMFDAVEKQLGDLKRSRDTSEGRIGGISAGWGYLAGLVGLAAAVVTVVLAFN
jgi:Flp pilus assembly protein TadB